MTWFLLLLFELGPPQGLRDLYTKATQPLYCIVLPTRSLFQKQGLGRDFISGCYRNSVGKAYRARYTYSSNLVARTRLPPQALCMSATHAITVQVSALFVPFRIKHFSICY